jgi:hypothetical protein
MPQDREDVWLVDVTGKAKKQKEKLPPDIKAAFDLLEFELKTDGPERRNWPHYGPVAGKGKRVDMRHCHLNKTRPYYVAVWVVTDPDNRFMELRYVGTHQNADYRRIN